MAIKEKITHQVVGRNLCSELRLRYEQDIPQDTKVPKKTLVERMKGWAVTAIIASVIRESMGDLEDSGVIFMDRKVMLSPWVQEDMLIMHYSTFEKLQRTFPPWMLRFQMEERK